MNQTGNSLLLKFPELRKKIDSYVDSFAKNENRDNIGKIDKSTVSGHYIQACQEENILMQIGKCLNMEIDFLMIKKASYTEFLTGSEDEKYIHSFFTGRVLNFGASGYLMENR